MHQSKNLGIKFNLPEKVFRTYMDFTSGMDDSC